MRGHIMWGKSQITIAIALMILSAGCQDSRSFYDANRNDINKVPLQIENSDAPYLDEATDEEAQPNEASNTPSENSANDQQLPEQQIPDDQAVGHVDPQPEQPIVVVIPQQPSPARPPVRPPVRQPTRPPVKPPTQSPVLELEASKFIKMAYWVVQNEARKLGTPCNFYVSRVLELSGYSDESFLANDFDIYARKNFRSYKQETFTTSNLKAERQRLKNHIWSYPSRTPFILQWTRPIPRSGHIAIMERIGDKLVIYQSSLNRHIARREQTTIEELLKYSRAAQITVYADFVAR